MRLKLCIAIILLAAAFQNLYSFDINNIAAYPVPFNPQKIKLTIGDPAGAAESHAVKVKIYDINGDLVINRSGSQFPLYWNGRNSSGRYVKPGLYIIKVEVDDVNGDYFKKIIRILVDY